MSIVRSDNFFYTNPKPAQEYERKLSSGIYVDWASESEVNAALSIDFRKNKYFWIAGVYYQVDSDGTTYRAVSGGGGGSETLQQVTDNGNTTTNDILIIDGSPTENIVALTNNLGAGNIELKDINNAGDDTFIGPGFMNIVGPNPRIEFENKLNPGNTIDIVLQTDLSVSSNLTLPKDVNKVLATSVDGVDADNFGNIALGAVKVAFAAPTTTSNTITVAALAAATTLVMVVQNKVCYNAAVDDGNKVSFSGTTLDMTNAGGVNNGDWLIIFYI